MAVCTYLSSQEVALSFDRQLFEMTLDETNLLKTQNTVWLTSITKETDKQMLQQDVINYRNHSLQPKVLHHNFRWDLDWMHLITQSCKHLQQWQTYVNIKHHQQNHRNPNGGNNSVQQTLMNLHHFKHFLLLSSVFFLRTCLVDSLGRQLHALYMMIMHVQWHQLVGNVCNMQLWTGNQWNLVVSKKQCCLGFEYFRLLHRPSHWRRTIYRWLSGRHCIPWLGCWRNNWFWTFNQ